MKTFMEKEEKLNLALGKLKNLKLTNPKVKELTENLFNQKNQLEIEKHEIEEKYKLLQDDYGKLKIRIKEQHPDKVLAVSPRRSDFKSLERKLHKMFKDKRVLKYEVFRNLNKDDIKVIMNELGNKINVDI